jgi:hypothetical protein
VIFFKQVVVGYRISSSKQHVNWENDCAWVITFNEVNAYGMYKVGSLDDEIYNTM